MSRFETFKVFMVWVKTLLKSAFAPKLDEKSSTVTAVIAPKAAVLSGTDSEYYCKISTGLVVYATGSITPFYVHIPDNLQKYAVGKIYINLSDRHSPLGKWLTRERRKAGISRKYNKTK